MRCDPGYYRAVYDILYGTPLRPQRLSSQVNGLRYSRYSPLLKLQYSNCSLTLTTEGVENDVPLLQHIPVN